jgi:hypothetical protein
VTGLFHIILKVEEIKRFYFCDDKMNEMKNIIASCLLMCVVSCQSNSSGGETSNYPNAGSSRVNKDDSTNVSREGQGKEELSTADLNKMKLDQMVFEDYFKFDSKDKLEARFGSGDYVHGTSLLYEGTEEFTHTIYTNPSTTHKLKYYWSENNKLHALEAKYHQRDKNGNLQNIQMIDSESGLELGMSLRELLEWNSGDFRFSGFGWDFGGKVDVVTGSKFEAAAIDIELGFKHSGCLIPNELMGDKWVETKELRESKELDEIVIVRFWKKK